MRVAVPRETAPGECRVALVPETVSKLRESGFEIRVERGQGTRDGPGRQGGHDGGYGKESSTAKSHLTFFDSDA